MTSNIAREVVRKYSTKMCGEVISTKVKRVHLEDRGGEG